VAGTLTAINQGVISKEDPLPLINMLILRLGVARMTVVKAYIIMKRLSGIHYKDSTK
jgi:DNA-binding GntR family transcriptional regulator